MVLQLITWGQERPLVVNNNHLFPPVRAQWSLPNCTHFSLIYYLKSSLWNLQFNRDPSLPENQFNNNFVWNQNINPWEMSNFQDAFYFMKSQGCATAADFPLNEFTSEIKPDLATRQKALRYKSKSLNVVDFYGWTDENRINATINELRDSLSKGIGFAIEFPILDYFLDMTTENNLYDCDSEWHSDLKVIFRHAVAIIGYDDTIKTALDTRGAFIAKDSHDKLDEGIFYLSYNWFRLRPSSFIMYFLEEDFSFQPEFVLNLKISGAISGLDYFFGQNSFVDTIVYTSVKGEQNLDGHTHWVYLDSISQYPQRFDFPSFNSWQYNRNQVQLYSVNGRRVPLRSDDILMPLNNKDGYYELIADLSDRVTLNNFESLSLIVFDPVAATYVAPDGHVYSNYTRAPSLKVEDAYIVVPGTDKIIRGKVVNLPDTTIVEQDFYSRRAGWAEKIWNYNRFIKTGTSVLSRKMITFSINDLISSSANQRRLPELSLQAYPNPARDRVSISFRLPQRETVSLSLYDVSGRFIGLITNQDFEAGLQEFAYDVSNLVSGIYIVHFKTGNTTQSFKIVKQ